MKKYVFFFLPLVLIFFTVSGCSSLPLTAFNPTETPTRTPRPTFTPRAVATDTPEITDTPAVTDAPTATDTTAPTKVVAKVTRPPAATAVPTKPPAPELPVTLEVVNFCPQEGGVYEIMIYLKHAGPAGKRKFASGFNFGVFGADGSWLKNFDGKNAASVTDDGAMSGYAWGSNCNRVSDALSPDRFNGKLDVNDVVRAGNTKLSLRFVKSATDATPLSKDIPLDFTKSGRWWVNLGTP